MVTDPRPRLRATAVVVATVAVVLSISLPPFGPASNLMVAVTALCALGVFLRGVMRLPSGSRSPWWWLFAMVAIITVNLVVVGIQAAVAGAGSEGGGHAAAAGAMVIVLYGSGLVGLAMMVRRPRPGEGAIVWLDTALIFLGAAAVISLVVIGPILSGSVPGSDGIFISLIYPLVDLVLLALVVRIAVGGVGGNPSLVALVAAFAVVVIIDCLIITFANGGDAQALQVRLIHVWVLWCVLMAAAAVLPGAARVRVQRPPGDLATPSAPWRLAVLGVAMLVAPVLLVVSIVRGDDAATALLLAITVLAIVVALLRVRAVLRIADARAADGVTVGEARERERIERDLHDGLQQHLIAIQFRLGALEAQLDTDPAAARARVDELREQADAALDDLRALARGIAPAELERAGVGPALVAITGPLPIDVTVDDSTSLRPCVDVEGAVYFASLEGIQNQMKHGAPGAPVLVRLATDGDMFTFSVGDARVQASSDLDAARPAPASVQARVARLGGAALVMPDAQGGLLLLGAIPLNGSRA